MAWQLLLGARQVVAGHLPWWGSQREMLLAHVMFFNHVLFLFVSGSFPYDPQSLGAYMNSYTPVLGLDGITIAQTEMFRLVGMTNPVGDASEPYLWRVSERATVNLGKADLKCSTLHTHSLLCTIDLLCVGAATGIPPAN